MLSCCFVYIICLMQKKSASVYMFLSCKSIDPYTREMFIYEIGRCAVECTTVKELGGGLFVQAFIYCFFQTFLCFGRHGRGSVAIGPEFLKTTKRLTQTKQLFSVPGAERTHEEMNPYTEPLVQG